MDAGPNLHTRLGQLSDTCTALLTQLPPSACRRRHCAYPFTPEILALTSASLTVSLIDLRRQVELQVAIVRVLQVILHEQGRVWAKAELHRAAERRSLREIDQVTQRESGSYWFVDRDTYLVLGLLCLARL